MLVYDEHGLDIVELCCNFELYLIPFADCRLSGLTNYEEGH